MNCEEALVLLSGYLDGSNTEEEMTQLREHLAECPACSRLLEAMEEIDHGVAALEEEAPADLKLSVMNVIRREAKPNRKLHRWVPVAAAAAVALVIGFGANGGTQVSAPVMVTADQAAPAVYARSTNEQPAFSAEVASQDLADRLGAEIVVTKELLPEMEICSCETLEDGSLLYQLPDAFAAAALSEQYGLELYLPTDTSGSDVSYARLLS